jgi:two-component system OmpR family sensor kinase
MKRVREAVDRSPSEPPVESDETRTDEIADLREAIRARDDFIAIAAHELRNPITPIMLSLELIRHAERSGDSAKLTGEIDRLERLLERFLARTGMLLDVARINSTNFAINRVNCNLSELVKTVVRDYAPAAEMGSCELIAKIEENICSELDPDAIIEILENLLSNAIKYGQGKPVEVNLVAGGQIRIAIRDHGAGIAPEDREKIFERFERLVGKNYRSGFGVGLWIARKFAEAMSGSIELQSAQGAGSMFTVVLPRNSSQS